MPRNRLGCVGLAALGFLLLSCLCWGLLPREAGAEGETPVIVTNWPTPVATATPLPTYCATPERWQTGAAFCGIAAVPVAHAGGEGGYALLQAAVTLFGLAFIGVCVLIGSVVRSRQ